MSRRAAVILNYIWMDNIEIDVVLRFLGKVENFMEWGSGGSALIFEKNSKLISVSIYPEHICDAPAVPIDPVLLRELFSF